MFKITELVLKDINNVEYPYEFSSGINFFRGKNSSGKTVFYELLDYMFGASESISNKEWYINLKEVSLKICIDNKKFILTRTKDIDENYISILDTEFTNRHPISAETYNIKLGHIFSKDENLLEDIKTFTGVALTYRSFTMFNFLGENGQGMIRYFFDKCSDVKYSVKLAPVLNFIFNNHQEEIANLEEKLKDLLNEYEILKAKNAKYEFLKTEINRNSRILRLNIEYNGKNKDDIKDRLQKLKNLEQTPIKAKKKSLSELELMYNNIDEQINLYEKSKQDIQNQQKENRNRKYLLENLNKIITNNNSLTYLIEPIKTTLKELDSTVSFSQYVIKDETINKLKKQRTVLKEEIQKYDSDYELYSFEEKEKAFVLLENYLTIEQVDCSEDLKNKYEEIKQCRTKIQELQNDDDNNKIQALSKYITDLYYTAKDISSFVKEDSSRDGFKIQYIKRGNILQPIINVKTKDNYKISRNCDVGSKARQTLIQLCGYLGFLNLLLKENKYPLIPIFVGDHLSQSFDDNNVKAIGTILNKASKDIGVDNLQIFLFDDKNYDEMNVIANNSEDLYKLDKENNIIQTGFVPFYRPPQKEINNKDNIKQ